MRARFVPLVVSNTHSLYGVIGNFSHFTDAEEHSYEWVVQSYHTLKFVKAHPCSLFHLITATLIQVRPGHCFYLSFQIMKLRLRQNQTAACTVDVWLEGKLSDSYLFSTELVLFYDYLGIVIFACNMSYIKVVISSP